MVATKKTPIKRATVKKTVATRKAAAKKAAAPKKVARKNTAKVTSGRGARPGSGVGGQKLPRDYNEEGFVIGSHSAIIAQALLDGGEDRKDVSHKVTAALQNKSTAGDLARNVPSMMSSIISRMKERGYSIESQWKLVPPTSNGKPTAVKAATRKVPVKKAAPAKKVVAKKVAPRKVTAKKVARRKA